MDRATAVCRSNNHARTHCTLHGGARRFLHIFQGLHRSFRKKGLQEQLFRLVFGQTADSGNCYMNAGFGVRMRQR